MGQSSNVPKFVQSESTCYSATSSEHEDAVKATQIWLLKHHTEMSDRTDQRVKNVPKGSLRPDLAVRYKPKNMFDGDTDLRFALQRCRPGRLH